jgi:predicted nucleic acid-binding protein
MLASDAFHDTNVVVYLLAGDARAERAEAVLGKGGRISVQVLNEFASVASRRLGMSWPEIDEVLAAIRQLCRVEPLTIETHEKALGLAARHKLGIYDATIVASALLAGCRVLHSEDFQDGQVFERQLRVVNPFRGAT